MFFRLTPQSLPLEEKQRAQPCLWLRPVRPAAKWGLGVGGKDGRTVNAITDTEFHSELLSPATIIELARLLTQRYLACPKHKRPSTAAGLSPQRPPQCHLTRSQTKTPAEAGAELGCFNDEQPHPAASVTGVCHLGM